MAVTGFSVDAWLSSLPLPFRHYVGRLRAVEGAARALVENAKCRSSASRLNRNGPHCHVAGADFAALEAALGREGGGS